MVGSAASAPVRDGLHNTCLKSHPQKMLSCRLSCHTWDLGLEALVNWSKVPINEDKRARHMAWASTTWVALEGLGLKQCKAKKKN